MMTITDIGCLVTIGYSIYAAVC